MKRTKPRTVKTTSSSKTISTQTDFDSFIEVARLEEQVRLLTLENNVLRKHAENPNNSEVEHQKSIYFTPQATLKSCGCKGNCSSRICGCVKKRSRCNSSCKCNDEICQNQEYNEGNKENINTTEVETVKKQSKKKNEEYQFNKINTIKDLRTDSNNIDNVELKEKKKEEKEKNKEQQESTEKVTFNPMKPRHQLSRTPPNKKLEKPLEQVQPQSHSESERSETDRNISFPKVQVKEEKVDWEEHTAQLIPCKKCKRTFLPNRIQKHEACCKKI